MAFFTIIIPTRNRYDTLPYAVATVLNQGFQDFELLISDNSDEKKFNEAESIHKTWNDLRVRVIRPNRVLSMSDHWEFAISRAEGSYLILFGDDDGLVADALQIIYSVIQRTKTDIVSWARVEYNWPDRDEYPNQIVFPYLNKTGFINSSNFIRKVVAYKTDYRFLPMFYNSAIRTSLVNSLKIETGKIFSATSPDIYSGFAFAHLSKRYLSVGHPLSINGVSAKSNGAAHSIDSRPRGSDHWSLLTQSTIKWPSILPDMYTGYLGIVEPFVQLSMFYPELKNYITRKKIYKIIIDTLTATTEEDFYKRLKVVAQSASDDSKLYRWIERYSRRLVPKIKEESFVSKYPIGFIGSHMILDGSDFDLKNVYQVSQFIPKLIGGIKDNDFEKPLNPSLFRRIRRALGIIKNGF